MGRRKSWESQISEAERKNQKEIMSAIAKQQQMHKTKVLQDMAKYHKNRERLAGKVAAARKLGLSYGYYVAFHVEFRGRLSIM
jgi:citrate lyase alpha subunit